jgi:hypothetical protein
MEFVQRKIREFRLRGFPQRINWLVDQAKPIAHEVVSDVRDELHELLDPPDGWRRRFFHGMLAFLRVAWLPVCYLCLAMLGAVPHLNVILGIPLCRALGRPGSLAALMIGNTLTIYTTDKLLDAVFWLWQLMPAWARAVATLALLAVMFARWRRRKAARKLAAQSSS